MKDADVTFVGPVGPAVNVVTGGAAASLQTRPNSPRKPARAPR
jgi:hypothetical protein